jgi:hypothetical protein
MKLSEIKGKEAIRTLANLMEPVSKIAADEEIQNAVQSKQPVAIIAKKLLLKHPDEVIEVLALLDGADPKTYEPSLLTLPMKLLEILNDEEIQALFFS